MPKQNHRLPYKLQRSNKRIKSKKSTLPVSADDPMEIPGFYYDHERDRYFKITPGHSFGSSKTRSTNTNGIETKKPAEKNINSFNKPRIPTCTSLLNDCELNPFKTIQRLQKEWRDIFVKSLSYVGTIQQTTPFSLSHRITDFQVHPTSNELYFGNVDGMVGLIKFQTSSKACSEIFNRPFAYCNSEITSIKIIGESLIIYTSLGNHLCSGILHIEQLPKIIDFDLIHEASAYNYQTRSTVWTSTFSQVDEWIALGATKYISILSNYSVPGARFKNIKTNSDVFALDNDQNQPSVIFAGCRDGRLLLFDIRSDTKKLSPHGNGPMIKQSTPICNLKKVGSWYILSDGMDGLLSLWDIRNQRKNKNVEESTLPVLKYFGHVNSTNRRTGFAVNSYNSIVAIAGQDNFIRFFSINTGDVVRTPIGPFEDTVSTIRFCEQDEKQNFEFLQDENDNANHAEHNKKDDGIWISVGKELQWWSV